MGEFSCRERQKKGSDSIAAFVVAVIVLLRLKPFYVWSNVDLVQDVCAILLPLICVFFVKKPLKNDLLYLCLFLISYSLVFFQTTSFVSTINRILLIVIPLLKENFLRKSYNYFKTIVSILFLLGVIEYPLVVLGLFDPLAVIAPLNELKSYSYDAHCFMVLSHSSLRFCSVFDEAGVVGTVCVLLLFGNNTRSLFSGWKDYAILLAGLLSFSFFFYVFLAIYFVVFPITRGGEKSIIPVVLSLIVAIVVIRSTPFLWDIIGSRFVIDQSTGSVEGDTRQTEATYTYVVSGMSPEVFLFGVGRDDPTLFAGNSSILALGYLDGFLFLVINLLAFIVMAFAKIFSKSKLNFFLYVIVLLGVFYQRPELINPAYIFLFTSLCYLMSDTFNEKNKFNTESI